MGRRSPAQARAIDGLESRNDKRRETHEGLSRLSSFSALRGSTSPTNTTLAVSDKDGSSQGHLWYDPHGSVLSSTLPVTLTEHIGLDSRLGLVYHGDGRYYDPVIAHTLQPDPFGGVPHLPQTLNRYSYAASTAFGCDTYCQRGRGFPVAEVVGVSKDIAFQVLGRRSIQTGVREFARLRVTASRTALTRNQYIPRQIRDLYGLNIVGLGSHGRYVAESMELGIEQAEAFKEYLDIVLPKGYGRGLGEAEIIARRLDPVHTRLGEIPWWNIADFGLDFLLGSGFQYLEDVNNPRLTSTQIGVRVFVAGTGGALLSALGGALGGVFASSLCGPGAPICAIVLVVGVVGGEFVGGLVWNAVQPHAFEIIGQTPADWNLRPLN